MADGETLLFTPAVEAETAAAWEKVKDRITPIEWRMHATLIAEINRLKREKDAVILAHIGPVAMAVTSNLNMSFLRAVEYRTVMADAELINLGKRLATVDVRLWQEDPSRVLAQATVTYAIPG